MPIATQPPAEQTLLGLSQQAGQRRDNLAQAQMRGAQAQQNAQLGLLQMFMQDNFGRDQMAQQAGQFQQQLGQDYRIHDETLGFQQTMFDAEHELARDQHNLADRIATGELNLAIDRFGLEETQTRMGNLMGAMEGMLQLQNARQQRNVHAQGQAALEGRPFTPEGPTAQEIIMGNIFRQNMNDLGLAPEGMDQTQQGGILGMTGQVQIPGAQQQDTGEIGFVDPQAGSTGPGRFAYEDIDPSISGYQGLMGMVKSAGDFARGLVFQHDRPFRKIDEALRSGNIEDIDPKEFRHRNNQLLRGEYHSPGVSTLGRIVHGSDHIEQMNREMADIGLQQSREYLDQRFNHLIETEGMDQDEAYNQAVREALPTEKRRYFQAQFALDEIQTALGHFTSAQMAGQTPEYIQDRLQALGYRGPLSTVIDRIRTDIEQGNIEFVYPEQRTNMQRQIDRLGSNIFERPPDQPPQQDFAPTGQLTPVRTGPF